MNKSTGFRYGTGDIYPLALRQKARVVRCPDHDPIRDRCVQPPGATLEIDAGTCLFKLADGTQWPANGDPYWSWTYAHSHDLAKDYISIYEQGEHVDDGYQIRFDDPKL